MLSKYVSLGQLVEAIKGRDQGEKFFVVEILGKDYVKIANGKTRKIENPKLKKTKHLNISNYIDEDISLLLKNKDNITNSFIRAKLSKLK